MSDKVDTETKPITKDKGHYYWVKGSVQEENITCMQLIQGANI